MPRNTWREWSYAAVQKVSAARIINLVRRIPGLRNSDIHPISFPEEPLDSTLATQGGFVAFAPGSRLSDGRYTIVGKLGHGRYASTWLVKDGKHRNDAYVVKVASAYATEAHDTGVSLELEVLQIISAPPFDADRHLVFLTDHFLHSTGPSPDDKHLCFVMDAGGQTLAEYIHEAPGGMLPPYVVKIVAAHILKGLECAHARGVIHADIKPSNIFFRADHDVRVAALDRQMAYHDPVSGQEVGQEKSEPINMPWSPTDGPYTAEKYGFILGDFGQAQLVGRTPTVSVIQPVALRAPEIILGGGFDTSADIWNFACLIFELLTGAWLFSPGTAGPISPEDDHLRLMMEVTQQRFSDDFLARCANASHFFDHDGNLLRAANIEPVSLASALQNYAVLSHGQFDLCVDFLSRCLRLDPNERATAKELLNHEYLKGAGCCCEEDDPDCYCKPFPSGIDPR